MLEVPELKSGGEVHLIPIGLFLKRYLNEASERIVQMRSFTLSSHRMIRIRNMTVAGELRGLDANIFLPGSIKSQWINYSSILKNNLFFFQKQDLKHWQESWYWFKILLMGMRNASKEFQLEGSHLENQINQQLS